MKAKFFHYAIGIVGPISVSGAHFIGSLIVFRVLEAREFGMFAFTLVMVQFGFSLSNALLGTPFTVIANQADYRNYQGNLFFKLNLLLSLIIGLIFFYIGWHMGMDDALPIFTLFSGLSILRWFLRSYFFAIHQPLKATISDVTYASVLLITLGFALMMGLTLERTGYAFTVASMIAIAMAGGHCLRLQFLGCLGTPFKGYEAVWRNQSRWTLLGVITTEATGNSHAWLVTFFAGPAAFAPLALAALFFRPVSLAANSLTQLERPIMTRALSLGDRVLIFRTIRHFRLVIMTSWILAVLVTFVVLELFPGIIIKDTYDPHVVMIAAILQAGISALYVWRTPESTLIQATGRFMNLAKASIVSSLVTLPTSLLLILIVDPVMSLIAILAGQAIMATLISRLFRQWRNTT